MRVFRTPVQRPYLQEIAREYRAKRPDRAEFRDWMSTELAGGCLLSVAGSGRFNLVQVGTPVFPPTTTARRGVSARYVAFLQYKPLYLLFPSCVLVVAGVAFCGTFSRTVSDACSENLVAGWFHASRQSSRRCLAAGTERSDTRNARPGCTSARSSDRPCRLRPLRSFNRWYELFRIFQ